MIANNVTTLYPTDTEQTNALKEQLRLFAYNTSESISPETLLGVQQRLSKRDRLVALLEGELNFHGENTGYASHDLHAFAAKFPPQLPRAFIRGLTQPGELILDPMMGSGTAIVEAVLEGRRAIGLDIDPLALRLCSVKTTPLNTVNLRNAGSKVLSRATALLTEQKVIEQALAEYFDDRTKSFLDYWFMPETQRELMALIMAIRKVSEKGERSFLELTLSSIIVTKSGGVSRARDLAHSRPHLDDTKVPKNALEKFRKKLDKNLISLARLNTNATLASPLEGDAKRMPFRDDVFDLIVTSPPYANAIDYMRAHKFSLVWLGETVSDLSELRAEYIGSERVGDFRGADLPDRPTAIIKQLRDRDKSKSAILCKYLFEMKNVLAEMHRVLRKNAVAVVVVGTSIMRDIEVQTHLCLADIAAEVGFDVVGMTRRVLDRNKRMMPARFGKKTDSMIEQRMHEEYVIGLLKPPSVC